MRAFYKRCAEFVVIRIGDVVNVDVAAILCIFALTAAGCLHLQDMDSLRASRQCAACFIVIPPEVEVWGCISQGTLNLLRVAYFVCRSTLKGTLLLW